MCSSALSRWKRRLLEERELSRADWSAVSPRPASYKTQDPWTKTERLYPQRPEEVEQIWRRGAERSM